MAVLKAVSASPIITCPNVCFWAEYDLVTKQVLRRDNGAPSVLQTPRGLVCAESREEVDSEIVRLGLIVPTTARQRAAAVFAGLPVGVQAQFAPAFQALSATDPSGNHVVPDAALIPAVTAVQVSAEDEQYKAAILAALNG